MLFELSCVLLLLRLVLLLLLLLLLERGGGKNRKGTPPPERATPRGTAGGAFAVAAVAAAALVFAASPSAWPSRQDAPTFAVETPDAAARAPTSAAETPAAAAPPPPPPRSHRTAAVVAAAASVVPFSAGVSHPQPAPFHYSFFSAFCAGSFTTTRILSLSCPYTHANSTGTTISHLSCRLPETRRSCYPTDGGPVTTHSSLSMVSGGRGTRGAPPIQDPAIAKRFLRWGP